MVVSQTFLKMQKRGSQVAVYLVIAAAVVGFVVSRLPGGSEESAPKSVAKAKPVRLFRPEAFGSLPAETTPAAKGLASSVITAEAKSELPETESATPESVEHPSTEPEAVGGVMPQPEAPVAEAALPIEPLPSWSERELLANLEETAIELDLYSGRPSLAEIQAQVESRAAEFKKVQCESGPSRQIQPTSAKCSGRRAAG